MDHEILVEEVIEEGRRLIERISEEPLPIEVAAWIKQRESRVWTIHIGASSPRLKDAGESARVVLRALAKMTDPSICLIDIELRDMSNIVPADLLKIRDRYPSMVATKLKTKRKIGNIETRGLYLYPANFELPSPNEIVHSVLQLLDRRGSASPSLVTFKDGSKIHAVPVGIRLNTPEGARIDWQDVVTSRERSVAADEVVSIV